jgi:SAM-dependent methyltransferase
MTRTISYQEANLVELASLEEHHFWFRARRDIILDALGRWFGGARDYLEVGCGTGYNARAIAEHFPKWRVVATDPLSSEPSIPRCDARALPYRGEFDVVGAYDVLEHIADDAAALQQFHQACRPGGGILLTVPQHPWLWSGADTFAQHHRRYTSRQLHQRLRAAGFEPIASTSFQTLTLPFFWARALALRGRDPKVKAPPATVNWSMGKLMGLDRRLIAAGVRLPAGGSLLVAARKI